VRAPVGNEKEWLDLKLRTLAQQIDGAVRIFSSLTSVQGEERCTLIKLSGVLKRKVIGLRRGDTA
jgi:hypothetical protein